MDISLNWLGDFIDIDEDVKSLSDKLTFGGLEVEGIRNYESIPGNLAGILIGEVMSCEKHPNADRLSLCKVDIGASELKPIVCGAPNVLKGQKVLVATVGTTIHPIKGESFKINKAKIRGEVSEGMICAEDELGLGDSHDGIMVLDTDLKNGTPANELFNNYQDKIIEIGLTPNRGDATSHLGVARDIKALYKKEIKESIPQKWPEKGESKKLEVKLINPEACPRYAGIVISDLKIQESPEWLQNRLKAIGLSPINNVVDATNFILHDLGQPLHAFDYDKIRGQKVIVKTGLKNVNFKTLDELDRKLHEEDLMICDDEGPMCIGGVFGGINSGVSESTSSIFLESACFDPVFIRKTSQRHGLKTDAAFRFERGTDIDICVKALYKAAKLLNEIAGGKISSELFDIYPEAKSERNVDLKKSDIKRLIGIEIPEKEIIEILNNLDIILIDDRKDSWTFEIPNYRTEVYRSADLIEEILRIYGFNNIPLEENSGSSYLALSNEHYDLEDKIAEILKGRKFNEVQTNSLRHPKFNNIEKTFGKGFSNAVILNKLSEDLGVMRDSMLPGLMNVALHNVNRKQQNLRLYEFGSVYGKKGDKYVEIEKLGMIFYGNKDEDSWLNKKNENPFYELKSHVNAISQGLGLGNLIFSEVQNSHFGELSYSFSIDNSEIGMMGYVNESLKNLIDIEGDILYCEMNLQNIRKIKKEEKLYNPVSRFPEVKRDLSLVLDKSVKYEDVERIALKKGQDLIKTIRIFDVFEGKPLDKNQKSYALSFILEDKEKTLEDKRIDTLMTGLINTFEKELNAVIRR